jgi:hypothetical protein
MGSQENPLTRGELLAALMIFLLPLLGVFSQFGIYFPEWFEIITVFILWAIVIFTLILAVVRRFPRWSFPYLGFLLSIGVILSQYFRLWVWTYPLFLDAFGSRAGWSTGIRILYAGIHETLMWLIILLSALALVNLLRLFPFTRTIWQKIRLDWTQFSYLLYGSLVVYIFLVTFDEYHFDGPWKLAASVCLTMGAWLYLRAENKNSRIMALVSGTTVTMWMVVIAKWVLIPLQKWPAGYPISPSEITRWTETGYTFISWIGFTLILLAPALFDLFPSAPASIEDPEEELVPA